MFYCPYKTRLKGLFTLVRVSRKLYSLTLHILVKSTNGNDWNLMIFFGLFILATIPLTHMHYAVFYRKLFPAVPCRAGKIMFIMQNNCSCILSSTKTNESLRKNLRNSYMLLFYFLPRVPCYWFFANEKPSRKNQKIMSTKRFASLSRGIMGRGVEGK